MTEKSRIKSMANQKFGTAMASWAKTEIPRSAARLRCAAAITPSGMAINAETSMPPRAKGTLIAARPAISSATGTPYV